jgi:hypothetical protein
MKNKTVGPYFVSYIVVKQDGKWLIEKSNTARMSRPIPTLSEIRLDSQPTSGQEFRASLRGNDFEPETIFLEVVGPGCPESKPCRVPNSALRENAKMSATELTNVPFTLASGSFRISAKNGESQASSPVVVDVP